MALGDFRTGLQALLAEELGIPFRSGYIEGPIERGPLGCAWTATVGEMPARVMEAEITVIVRVFLSWKQVQGPDFPVDAGPLETIVDQLQAAILTHQTGLGPWFQRLSRAGIDPVKQMVEATFVASTSNAALV